jgi:hypothetical protein
VELRIRDGWIRGGGMRCSERKSILAWSVNGVRLGSFGRCPCRRSCRNTVPALVGENMLGRAFSCSIIPDYSVCIGRMFISRYIPSSISIEKSISQQQLHRVRI